MAFPSTFADIRTAVTAKARLSTSDATKVNDWINQVYADVCVETEANVTSNTMALTANTYSYTLPSAVARIKEMYVTPSGATQMQPLRPTTLDQILRDRVAGGGAATSTGSVTHYALLGLNEFEVWPTPTTADVITIYYVSLPTALSDDSDVPILQEPWASRLLELGALCEAADFKGDPQEESYRQRYEVWKQRFRAHLTRRQGGQPGQFGMYPATTYAPHDPSTDIGG